MVGPRPLELADMDTFSAISMEPDSGQPTESLLAPTMTKDGQRPAPTGILMRASMRPYSKFLSPLVVMRVRVQTHLPLFSAQRTRCPIPSRNALGWRGSQSRRPPRGEQ